MRLVRPLLLILVATLFVVGGVARALPMPMPAATPPCHEAPANHGKSMPVQAAMTCCIGCMPAPTEAAPLLADLPLERPAYSPIQTILMGRLTTPDPDPPRLRV